MENPNGIEEHFNSMRFDFLEELMFEGSEFNDCTLSNEELLEFVTPSQEKWNALPPKDHPSQLKIDVTKDLQWKLAKKEIEHVRKRVHFLLREEQRRRNGLPQEDQEQEVDDEDEITAAAIVMYTLGPTSDAGKYMIEALEIDDETYLKFMTTLFLQAAYRVSTEELFHNDSLLKDLVPMAKTEFNLLWKCLAEKKMLPTSEIRTARQDAPLWEKLETIVNTVCSSVSIVGRKGTISIALDDDKIWFSSKVAKVVDLFNLKFTTHNKANRKGIVAHTAVSTGANIPLGIVYERKNDGCIDCFKRLLDFSFKKDGTTNLRNVRVHSDRGYTLPDLVFQYILKSGGEIVGTIKRTAQCWPFTFGQTLNETDKRINIDQRGAPTLFLSWCKAGSKHLFASAFRNGSDRVATAISSLHKSHEWEGIAFKPAELRAYQADSSALISKFFQRVELDDKDEESPREAVLMEELLEDRIEPFTLRQGTADWHYLRKFSLTSSQAHKAFAVAFPDYKDNPSFVAVAKYMFGNAWRDELNVAPAPTPVDPPFGDGSEHGEADNLLMHRSIDIYLQEYVFEDTEEGAYDEVAVTALGPFVGLSSRNQDSDSDTSDEEDGESAPSEKALSENEAKEMIKSWGSSLKQAVKQVLLQQIPEEMRNKSISNADLVLWLQASNAERSYMFYSSAGLKNRMQERNLVLIGRSTMQRMRAALAGTNTEGVQASGTDTSNGNVADVVLTAKEAAVRAILERSFLPHQKGQKREYCSLGHRLEVPILKSWIEVASECASFADLEVKGAYTAGLAAKQGALYAKDSIDFIITVEDQGSLETWGFEAKGRVTADTAADEEHNLRNFADPHTRIDDADVHDLVRSPGERFQVLQHAYVYGFDTVVLAISDNQSEIIQSVIIDFSPELRQHFGRVLKDLKDLALSWAYPEQPLPPRHQIIQIPEEVLAIGRTIKQINGDETFQGTANLWYAMCVLPRPIPSLLRIIPGIYAFWNAVKGGSDTTTKLMDDCLVRIPKCHMNTETVAISRLLMLLMVLNHRLIQLFTANKELAYPSLLHYRHAASARTTFHRTLVTSSTVFKDAIRRLAESNGDRAVTFAPTPPPVRRIAPSRRNVNGVVPQDITFGGNLGTQTPKKHATGVTLRYGKASEDARDLVFHCSGIPMKRSPAVQKDLCALCSKFKTSWYCAGCKRWLCMDRRPTKDNPTPDLYAKEVCGTKVDFAKLCFHKAHEAAWIRQAAAAADKENVQP